MNPATIAAMANARILNTIKRKSFKNRTLASKFGLDLETGVFEDDKKYELKEEPER